MHTTHSKFYEAALCDLRPTQITVGYAEVIAKQTEWKRLKKSERKDFLSNHWFPAVRGPEEEFYIIDHHHLGKALLDIGVKKSRIVLLKDLSHLALDEFWLFMAHQQWVHPYDAKGKRRSVRQIPHTLDGLLDDPYRSLAGEVRQAGGFPKDTTPYAEFLWADFFRRRIKTALVIQFPTQALEQALSICHSAEASHLPGWTGLILQGKE